MLNFFWFAFVMLMILGALYTLFKVIFFIDGVFGALCILFVCIYSFFSLVVFTVQKIKEGIHQ